MKWHRTHSCNHWHVLSKASLLLEHWTEHKLQLVWQHAHQKCLFIFTHWSCNIKASWPLSEMTPHQNSSQLQSTSHAMAKLRDAESCTGLVAKAMMANHQLLLLVSARESGHWRWMSCLLAWDGCVSLKTFQLLVEVEGVYGVSFLATVIFLVLCLLRKNI